MVLVPFNAGKLHRFYVGNENFCLGQLLLN